MEKLLLVTAVVCLPGDRLIDLSSKIPREVRSMDFVVSLEPFYARFYIYQPGFPDTIQQCCSSKSTGFFGWPKAAISFWWKGRLRAAFLCFVFNMPESALPVLGSSMGGWDMKDNDLAKMPLDDLWRLHEQIIHLLDRKLQQEARKLQHRLDELGRKFGGTPSETPSDIPQRRPTRRSSQSFETQKTPQKRGRDEANSHAG